jgi:hypothetical protein
MPQIEILRVLHRANSIDGRTDCSGRTHLCSVGMPPTINPPPINIVAENVTTCLRIILSPVVTLKDPVVPTSMQR